MYDMFRKLASTDHKSDKLDFLIQQINRMEKAQYLNSIRMSDVYSLNLLQPLLNGYPVLPFTASSLRPFCLVTILNEIMANRRTSIIEIGSGISTIIMARLIKINELNATVTSVEHNENWSKMLVRLLNKEQLDPFVKVIYAPLAECDLALESNKWYDREILSSEISGKSFDLVLVDGPPAFNPADEKSRYPALPFLFDHLSENCSIYLDDADRKGEKFVKRAWEEKFSVKFQQKGPTLAHFARGKAFFAEPLLYL